MSVIPSNLARVPNTLASRLHLASLTRNNLDLLRVQEQLSSGRAINRVSDDPVKAATIATLDDRLERSAQRKRNLTHAQAALSDLDAAIAAANDTAGDAKDIAAQMVQSGSSAGDRQAQSVIVQQLLNSLYATSARQGVAGYVFGGSTPGTRPVEEFRGGYRFRASGDGITTDLGSASTVPITMGPNNPIGATSARVRGTVDLDPDLTAGTRLADLNGARGLGVTTGTVEFAFNGGPTASVDLSGCDTIDDVRKAVQAAIQQYETDNSVTVLGPGGVSLAGAALSMDIAAGGSLQFYDVGSAVTAKDLGLTAATPFAFTPASPNGVQLDPKLTWTTPVASLAGVVGALGQITIKNLGATATLDLSTATTLQDVKNMIEGTGLGVRVEINDAGTGIDVLNEVAGTRSMAFSIEEVTGQNSTASRLGIRTFSAGTLISDFNDGRGAGVIDGVVNPTTGTVDPSLNSDFEIVLGDPAGTRITIDLTAADMTSVQSVMDAMNTQINTQLVAAGLAVGDFYVGLSDGKNGLQMVQNAAFTNPISVEQKNNSPAARDLGLLTGTYNSTTKTWEGEDTARVRVDNLFTHLLDLRDALATNDTTGIAFASSGIESSIDLLAEKRGLVGGYAQRVQATQTLEEDQTVLDESIRSGLRDVDFTEAAMRLSLVQTQLSAALQVAASSQQRTLMDYL